MYGRPAPPRLRRRIRRLQVHQPDRRPGARHDPGPATPSRCSNPNVVPPVRGACDGHLRLRDAHPLSASSLKPSTSFAIASTPSPSCPIRPFAVARGHLRTSHSGSRPRPRAGRREAHDPAARLEARPGLIEFALVAPRCFILLLLSIIEFGRAVYYIQMLDNAAREGAAIRHRPWGCVRLPVGPMPTGPNSCDPTASTSNEAVKDYAIAIIDSTPIGTSP